MKSVILYAGVRRYIADENDDVAVYFKTSADAIREAEYLKKQFPTPSKWEVCTFFRQIPPYWWYSIDLKIGCDLYICVYAPLNGSWESRIVCENCTFYDYEEDPISGFISGDTIGCGPTPKAAIKDVVLSLDRNIRLYKSTLTKAKKTLQTLNLDPWKLELR